MSHLTTHVLDASRGVPAAGIAVRLTSDGELHGSGTTDADGRIAELGPEVLTPGTYTLTFATGPYFAALGQPTIYPSVAITFTVDGPGHLHLPVLLSPFSYTTYRGS